MSPVPRVVCTVVTVEHIIACLLQVLNCALTLLHISARFDIILTGKRTLAEILSLGKHAVSQRYGEILSAHLFNCLNNFNRKAVSVFEGAAVAVITLIYIFERELVKKIALVNGVNLYTVNACVLELLCCFCKSVNHFLYFFNSHFP